MRYALEVKPAHMREDEEFQVSERMVASAVTCVQLPTSSSCLGETLARCTSSSNSGARVDLTTQRNLAICRDITSSRTTLRIRIRQQTNASCAGNTAEDTVSLLATHGRRHLLRATRNMSVTLQTTHGDVKVELFCQACPKTTYNFLALCASGEYDGSPFHRLIPNCKI